MEENSLQEKTYVAFISYRHLPLDTKAAMKVQKRIEGYTVPREMRKSQEKKHLGKVFRDEDELPLSSNLSDSIIEALEQSEYLIVICTPDLPKSEWCKAEIEYFLKIRDRDHILAVLADGKPEESFSPLLLHTFDEEGNITGNIEPLAANIDGKNHTINSKAFGKEIVRIYAAILGCSFDSLWQRERRNRTKRMLEITGAAAVVMAVFSIVLFNMYTEVTLANARTEQANAKLEETNKQLIMANETLVAQKEELQRNESSLLAEKAAEAMEANVYNIALSHAAAALPQSEDDTRPYCAAAEKVLSEALMIYRNVNATEDAASPSKECLLTFNAEQDTEIIDLRVSNDGNSAFTLDKYNTIRCLDRKDGNVRWRFNLFSDSVNDFLYNPYYDMLYVCHSGNVSAINCADGSMAWRYTAPTDMGFSTLVLSEDGRYLACFVSAYTDYPTHRLYLPLTFLLCENGECVQRFRVPFFSDNGYTAGVFSEENSNLFAYTFNSDFQDGNGTTRCFYLIDVASGTASILNGQTVETESIRYDEKRFMHYSEKKHSLTVICDSCWNKLVAVQLFCLDTENGRLIWKYEIPGDGNNVWYTPVDPNSVEYNLPGILYDDEKDAIYLGIGKLLYMIDSRNGKLMAQYQKYGDNPFELSGNVLSLFPAGNGFPGFLLDDGTTGCFWQKGSELCFINREYGGLFPNDNECTANVGLVSSGKVLDGGLRSAHYTEEENLVLGWQNGSIICVPKDSPCTVRFFRHFTVTCPWKPTVIEANHYINLVHMSQNRLSLRHDKIVYYLECTKHELLTDHNYEYVIHKLNIETLEDEKFIYSTNKSMFYNNGICSLLPTSDGSGFLVELKNGDLQLYHSDTGKSDVLWIENSRSLELEEDEPEQRQVSGTMVHTAWQMEDGSAIGAACDGNCLHLWINGQEQISVELPEEMQWEYVSKDEVHRMLVAGENGYVLLSDYSGCKGENAFSNFAVYSIKNKTWRVFQDEAAGRDSRKAVFSPTEPLFAIGDEDNTLRIYNAETGSCKLHLELPGAGSGIERIGFTQDGAFIFVFFGDRVFLYKMGLGELVYDTVFSVGLDAHEFYFSPVDIVHDATQNRLFFQTYNAPCSCLDTRSYSEIAEMDWDVVAVLPEYKKVLVIMGESNGFDRNILALRQMPTTLEMTKDANEIVARMQE